MKRILSLTACVLAALLIAGCSGAPEDPAPFDAQAEPEAGPKSITVAAGRSFWQGPTTNIYVHGSTNVWESLVMFDDDMNPEMRLAESMSVSQDGLTWTIVLREGVLFHDGTALDADTAIYNIERLYRFNPAAKAYDPEYAKTGEYGEITAMQKVDERTLSVTHARPIPDFDARLSYENSAMFAMASFDDDRAIQTPIGTGPYQYQSYDESAEILTLTKFEGYRRGEPRLDEVKFRNIADATARLAALQSGEVDVISDVGGIMPQQAAQVLADPSLTLKQRQVSTVHYACVNAQEGRLFSDRRMRNALSACVDREGIVSDLLLGYGAEAVSVVTDISGDWTVDCGYEFDTAQAETLVQEAVQEETPVAVIVISNALTGRWPYQDVALMLQSELIGIGIDARIERVDAAAWSQRLKEGDYDISIHPFTVSAGEPNYFFTRNLQTGGSNNVARGYGISDAELDDLIAKADVELDKAARQELYAQMQRLVREEDYIIPIWYDVTLYAMRSGVQNFEIDVTFCPDMFAVDVAK